MSSQFSIHRRSLIASTLAATAAGLTGLIAPGLAIAQARLRTSNVAALTGGKRVVLGSVALACLTDRKRQILVGGGFRSRGAASSNVVETTLAGLTAADFPAAADAAYAAAVAGLKAQGFDVVDNASLVAMLKSNNLVQANGGEYSFPEGNKQSSKALMMGASAYDGYVPIPGWTPVAPGLAGLASIGLQTAARNVESLFRKQAAESGVAVISLMIGVSPVRIEASFGATWRVPDAFGNGGQTRTGTLSTETGLSSHPQLTRMAIFPTSGEAAGDIAIEDEVGIQGGIGALADTTPGMVSGVQAVGNVLSMFSGSGRSDNTTSYTLNADPAAYVAGTKALSNDVVKALVGGFSQASRTGPRSGHAPEPPHRQPCARHQQDHRRQRQQGRQLGVARAHLQARTEVLVDGAQRLGRAGMVVLAACHLRDLAQRGFVQLKVDGHALAQGSMAVGGAQADDVDPHASIGGHLRRFQRVHPRGAAAVAQQD
ncbi:MAG: hypothetical protein Q8L92_15395, partial [Rubrivivax sp.]|nr:hypothetical protein [Rubrivivax sp.]